MAYIESETAPPAPQKRPTIGYLALNINDDVNGPRWRGIIDEARAQHVNLLTIRGGFMNNKSPRRDLSNLLYDLHHPETYDGMILAGILSEDFTSEEEIRAFMQRLPPYVVSLRPLFSYIPHIPSDNYQGMRTAIEHLIEVHLSSASNKNLNSMRTSWRRRMRKLIFSIGNWNRRISVWGPNWTSLGRFKP